MSVIPVSRLSPSDLALLGNNVGPAVEHDQCALSAVNRSLAGHGESVGRLYRLRPRTQPSPLRRSRCRA